MTDSTPTASDKPAAGSQPANADATPVVPDALQAELDRYKSAADSLRDIFLADSIHFGEIPAPTFAEEDRIRFLAGRFEEVGLANISIDRLGNGIGVIPGAEGRRNLLVMTNADTLVKDARDQTIEVRSDHLVGPFVGDNCIALAAMTTLPLLLERLDVRFKSNIILLAATRSLERGNLEGLKHFLAESGLPIEAGICLESVQLGRLNYHCIGLLRGEIHCRLPEKYNWAQYGTTGSIVPMSDVIGRISQMALPHRPLTTIIMGMIKGGIAYNNIARETVLSFEARSESLDILNQIKTQIADFIAEVGARSGVEMKLDVIAQREPGGLDISHALVRKATAVFAALKLQPMLYSTTSQLSAIRDAKIPGLTVGLTTGERRHELDEIDESVNIAPLSLGLAQVAGILHAIDEGGVS